jgi:hypothetical protein
LCDRQAPELAAQQERAVGVPFASDRESRATTIGGSTPPSIRLEDCWRVPNLRIDKELHEAHAALDKPRAISIADVESVGALPTPYAS